MRIGSDQGEGKWIDRLVQEARVPGDARMLKDDQPLTDELRKTVLAGLRAYLDRSGMSQSKAARSMAMSETTLSEVLSGNYGADDEPIVRKIDQWIGHQIAKEKAPKDPGFVRTSVAGKIMAVAKWVSKTAGIGLIVGPAGCGKTRTLRALRSQYPGSIYISITRAGQSTLSVLDSLAQAIKPTGMRLTSKQLHDYCVDLLRDTGRMIIVDEAHKLAGRRRDEALHALRDFYDASGTEDDQRCPMILAGMREIADYLDQGKNKFESLEQLDTRINMRIDLTEDALTIVDGGPGLVTVEDVEKFLAAQEIRVTPDAKAYLHRIGNEPRLGFFRTIKALVGVAREVAGDKAIDAKLLRSIFTQQRGARFVSFIEQQIEQRLARVG
jgi:DNA transposition AAA+ family ATPase